MLHLSLILDRKLVEPPYISSIDWSKWLIFYLDERVVPLDHPDCNHKLAFDGFLSKVILFFTVAFRVSRR